MFGWDDFVGDGKRRENGWEGEEEEERKLVGPGCFPSGPPKLNLYKMERKCKRKGGRFSFPQQLATSNFLISSLLLLFSSLFLLLSLFAGFGFSFCSAFCLFLPFAFIGSFGLWSFFKNKK